MTGASGRWCTESWYWAIGRTKWASRGTKERPVSTGAPQIDVLKACILRHEPLECSSMTGNAWSLMLLLVFFVIGFFLLSRYICETLFKNYVTLSRAQDALMTDFEWLLMSYMVFWTRMTWQGILLEWFQHSLKSRLMSIWLDLSSIHQSNSFQVWICVTWKWQWSKLANDPLIVNALLCLYICISECVSKDLQPHITSKHFSQGSSSLLWLCHVFLVWPLQQSLFQSIFRLKTRRWTDLFSVPVGRCQGKQRH